MKQILLCGAALAAVMAAPSLASAEEVIIKGPVSDVFGHRVVVQSDAKKFLVNLGPKISELGSIKSGDTLAVEGDLTKSGEVRAYNVTLADGKKLEVSKDTKTWREWLLGEDDSKHKTFTVDDAKKLATGKGYTLQGDPVAEKKHFTAKATKDGKSYELDLHRDGTIKQEIAFNADDAKRAIMAKGYEVVGEPQRIHKHYEALTRKSSEYFEVHANRDGAIKEARKVDKTDPKWGAQIP